MYFFLGTLIGLFILPSIFRWMAVIFFWHSLERELEERGPESPHIPPPPPMPTTQPMDLEQYFEAQEFLANTRH